VNDGNKRIDAGYCDNDFYRGDGIHIKEVNDD